MAMGKITLLAAVLASVFFRCPLYAMDFFGRAPLFSLGAGQFLYQANGNVDLIDLNSQKRHTLFAADDIAFDPSSSNALATTRDGNGSLLTLYQINNSSAQQLAQCHFDLFVGDIAFAGNGKFCIKAVSIHLPAKQQDVPVFGFWLVGKGDALHPLDVLPVRGVSDIATSPGGANVLFNPVDPSCCAFSTIAVDDVLKGLKILGAPSGLPAAIVINKNWRPFIAIAVLTPVKGLPLAYSSDGSHLLCRAVSADPALNDSPYKDVDLKAGEMRDVKWLSDQYEFPLVASGNLYELLTVTEPYKSSDVTFDPATMPPMVDEAAAWMKSHPSSSPPKWWLVSEGKTHPPKVLACFAKQDEVGGVFDGKEFIVTDGTIVLHIAGDKVVLESQIH